jgi:hypothetical protein
MLAITFYNLHLEGGAVYITPLTFLFVINIGIFIYVSISLAQKKSFNIIWLEALRQIGILILALGAFGTVVGFLHMFDALESMKETLPLQVISGGVKVALLAVIYGLVLFSITQAAYIILKVIAQKRLVN